MPTRPRTVELRRALFEDASAIIEAEYWSDLTVEEVARRIATSRRQLQRAFIEVGGVTFRDVLWAVRMDRAAELFAAQPSRPVRDVARAVGYRQPAQFAKAFRRRHGVTPNEFRRPHRQRAAEIARKAAEPRRPEWSY